MSFSGLKTAVLHAVRGASDLEADKAHIARAFQDALIETLVEKTLARRDSLRRQRVVLGGGVACNAALVQAMRDRAEPLGATVFAPIAPPRDGQRRDDRARRTLSLRARRTRRLDLNAYASLPLPGLLDTAAAPQ